MEPEPVIEQIGIPVSDLARSKAFYRAALAPLGYQLLTERDDGADFGRDQDDPPGASFRIHQADAAPGRTWIGFAAQTREEVARFRAAALAAGASETGAEGDRLLDPDGHVLEAVWREPAQEPVEAVMTAFIRAFDPADLPTMAELLDDQVVSYITNAEGGVKRLDGRAAFMANIQALEVERVKPSATITQFAQINPRQGLIMVEVRAQRKGRSLHNHAAFLMTLSAGRIREIRMVEALPAYSDAFWKR